MSNLAPTLVVAALISAAAGAAAGYFVAGRGASTASASEPAAPADSPRVAALEQRLAELQQTITELREQSLTSSRTSSVAVDESTVEAAVARWMAQNQPAAKVAESSTDSSASSAARQRSEEIAQALAKLLDPGLSWDERERMWREFGKKGLTDALVAEFERRAELDPDNPDRKCELGEAYLQKLFTVGQGPESGVWATKADKAFDSALKLDDHHWEARFSKAMSLSFWPPVFGKQGEAISNFETLVAQQAGQPKDAKFADTHLLLGNMYQQTGEKEKALAAWQAGYALYPDNEDLKKQIELAQGH